MSNHHQLTPKLKSLRLSGILETLEVRTQQAITEQLSYGDFLQRLVEDEVERRGQKQTLDQTKTLESFDFGFNPTLNRQQAFDLATCRFVEQRASLLIQGPAGVGKSHLAQALGA
jgi:DNA replication protein DnaC